MKSNNYRVKILYMAKSTFLEISLALKMLLKLCRCGMCLNFINANSTDKLIGGSVIFTCAQTFLEFLYLVLKILEGTPNVQNLKVLVVWKILSRKLTTFPLASNLAFLLQRN